MKRILWCVLIFLSLVFSSHTLFETTLDKQGCYYEGVSVLPSESGGWLVSGAYNCDGNPAAWKSCLVEIDAAGDTVSVKRDNPYNGIMRRMPDGNLVFAGGNHAGFAYDTAKIFKVKDDGLLLWEKSLFPGYCHHILTDILPLEDGFLILGNYAQGSCTSPVYDAYVAKLDTAGDLMWQHTVCEAGNDQLHAVRITGSKHIAAFGWSEKKSGADDADYFLILLDTNGNKIWTRTHGDERDNYGYGMDVLPDGGFILNGHTSTMDIIRLDSNGNPLWSKSLTETCGGRYFKTYSAQDGGLLFLGMEKSTNQTCSSVIIKTNPYGEIFWKKNFPGVIREVHEYQIGRYALAGYRSYLPKLYVAAFDSTTSFEQKSRNATLPPDLHKNLYSETPGETETATQELNVKHENSHRVYPNPATDIVHFEFSNSICKKYHLEIFNAQGECVMSKISFEEKITVSENISKGAYTYRLSGDEKALSGRIIFQ